MDRPAELVHDELDVLVIERVLVLPVEVSGGGRLVMDLQSVRAQIQQPLRQTGRLAPVLSASRYLNIVILVSCRKSSTSNFCFLFVDETFVPLSAVAKKAILYLSSSPSVGHPAG